MVLAALIADIPFAFRQEPAHLEQCLSREDNSLLLFPLLALDLLARDGNERQAMPIGFHAAQHRREADATAEATKPIQPGEVQEPAKPDQAES